MIESNFENLIKAYRKVQMTPDEKREVYRQSMLVIEKIEAVSIAHSDKKLSVNSLLSTDSTTGSEYDASGAVMTKRTFVSTWMTYIKKRQFIPALVSAFVLLFTGGTSMLADQALPGDSLYSFKVNINEPVRELAAVTNEARAKLAVEITERRLQEAAVLSSQGKLDEPNKKILQDQFTKHAGQIRNRVASLVASNNLNAAQEVVVDFESALKAHEIILERLSLEGDNTLAIAGTEDLSATTTTDGVELAAAATPTQTNLKTKNTSGVGALLVAVKSELSNTKNARIGIEEKVLATLAAAPSSTSLDATPIQVIESNTKELRFTIFDIQSELKLHNYSTTTLDLVNKRIDSASSSISLINSYIKSNQIGEAITLSQNTLRSLAEVETILKLEKTTSTTLGGKIDISSVVESAVASSTEANPSGIENTKPLDPTSVTSSSSSATI